ncbi:MAG TPA: M48 family metalloprotease, partial [Bellilinea sp.]
ARHSAEQIAKAQLTAGLTGAAVIAACDPNSPNGCIAASQIAAVVGQLISMKYSREDEIDADWLGVCFMNDSGYDPQDMVKVMQLLDSLSQGERPPEFFSTHPDPGNRVLQIQEAIQNLDQCP